MTHNFSAVLPPELRGINNELSIANDGGIVWNDRGYAFVDLPNFLVGKPFFQMPVMLKHEGGVMKILIYQPSTIYIALSTSYIYHGGFNTALPNDGWILQQGQIRTDSTLSNFSTLKTIWKKTFTTLGLTTIALPAMTEYLIGVIFVAGNTFKLEPIS